MLLSPMGRVSSIAFRRTTDAVCAPRAILLGWAGMHMRRKDCHTGGAGIVTHAAGSNCKAGLRASDGTHTHAHTRIRRNLSQFAKPPESNDCRQRFGTAPFGLRHLGSASMEPSRSRSAVPGEKHLFDMIQA